MDDPNDLLVDPANTLYLAFDLDHNGRWDERGPSREGILQITNGSAWFVGSWGTYPNNLGADVPRAVAGIVRNISNSSGHVQYEISLDLAESPFRVGSGHTVGASIWVNDPGNHYFDHYGAAGEWPYGFIWEAAESMGDLVLAEYTPPDTTTHPETILVTNTNDSGPGSLRQAIQTANTHPGRDVIEFNIPLSDPNYDAVTGVWVIRLQSGELTIGDDETIIDGATQKKFLDLTTSYPVIVLQGSPSIEHAFRITSSHNIIANLTMSGFNSQQLLIGGNHNHIYSCYIGTDATGMNRQTGSGAGIVIESGDYNEIGGADQNACNIISGLNFTGIELREGACHNTIRNNYIGINSAGSDTLGNKTGISLSGRCNGNIIGPGNTISGNRLNGVNVSASDSNQVFGNYVGLDPGGTRAWGNHGNGIDISNGAHNVVGGAEPGQRNVICGNWDGIQLSGENCRFNRIVGNLIGVAADGTTILGNGEYGVYVWQSTQNFIGGDTPEHGNVIGGNDHGGVVLLNARENIISHNYIGTDRAGTLNLGNLRHGIFLSSTSSSSDRKLIGPNNIIAFNGQLGVHIYNSSGNTITRNRMYANTSGGIFLSNGNGNLPAPQITSIRPVAGAAPPNSTVEIFGGREAQGETYLATVTADGSGRFSWSGALSGDYITATATDAAGNTSEFSRPVYTKSRFVVTNTNDSGPGSLRQAIGDAGAHAGADTIVFQIPITDPGYDAAQGVWTIQPTLSYGIDQDSLCIDGHSQAAFMGSESNPLGPEIVIDGIHTSGREGIGIGGTSVHILGLVLCNFESDQIRITGNHCIVKGCYIGTDATGRRRTQRSGRGILILGGSGNVVGGAADRERNIISGLQNYGILLDNETHSNEIRGNYIGLNAAGEDTLVNKNCGISIYSSRNTIGPGNIISGNWVGDRLGVDADSNRVIGNFIGTDVTGTKALGNEYAGIFVVGGASANTIGGSIEPDRNIISANGTGIIIEGNGTCCNQVLGNYVGTDISGSQPLPNRDDGIRVAAGANGQTIGPDNHIAYNGLSGIYILGPGSNRNRITRNQIHSNGREGIRIYDNGNDNIAVPVLTGYNPLVGTSLPNATIEIFSGPDDEGMYYEATVTADASGQFSWSGTVLGTFITATATDAAGNTSAFSSSLPTSVASALPVAPQEFALHANYPNPFNPMTTLVYDLPRPARVVITIFDLQGRAVRRLGDRFQEAGRHKLIWDGLDDGGQTVAAGVYFYRLEAKTEDGIIFSEVNKMVLMK